MFSFIIIQSFFIVQLFSKRKQDYSVVSQLKSIESRGGYRKLNVILIIFIIKNNYSFVKILTYKSIRDKNIYFYLFTVGYLF